MRIRGCEDESSDWRWHLVAPNNEIVAESGEGYASKRGATDGLDRVREVASVAEVTVTEDAEAVTTRRDHS